MRRSLISFLVVGLPGLCLLVGGAVSHEYPVAALGGALVIVAVYMLSRQMQRRASANDYKRERLSFVLAGIIGASLAVSGFLSDGSWVGAAGVIILIGSLLQLYRTTPRDD